MTPPQNPACKPRRMRAESYARNFAAARRVFLAAALCAPLAACGFRLREHALPPALQRVHVRGDDRDLLIQVRAELQTRGAREVSVSGVTGVSSVTAGAELHVRASLTRETLSVDANGLATAYALIYAVRYRIRKIGGESGAGDEHTFTLRRALDYAAAHHLAAESEARLLEAELRRAAAARIVSQLARG